MSVEVTSWLPYCVPSVLCHSTLRNEVDFSSVHEKRLFNQVAERSVSAGSLPQIRYTTPYCRKGSMPQKGEVWSFRPRRNEEWYIWASWYGDRSRASRRIQLPVLERIPCFHWSVDLDRSRDVTVDVRAWGFDVQLASDIDLFIDSASQAIL